MTLKDTSNYWAPMGRELFKLRIKFKMYYTILDRVAPENQRNNTIVTHDKVIEAYRNLRDFEQRIGCTHNIDPCNPEKNYHCECTRVH